MNIENLIDITFKLTDNINFFWNIYIFALIGLLGWLFALKNPPSKKIKIIVTSGFLLFTMINILGMLKTYAFLEAVRIELQMVAQETDFRTTLIKEKIKELNYDYYPYMVWITHLIVDAGVLFILWSDILKKSLSNNEIKPHI